MRYSAEEVQSALSQAMFDLLLECNETAETVPLMVVAGIADGDGEPQLVWAQPRPGLKAAPREHVAEVVREFTENLVRTLGADRVGGVCVMRPAETEPVFDGGSIQARLMRKRLKKEAGAIVTTVGADEAVEWLMMRGCDSDLRCWKVGENATVKSDLADAIRAGYIAADPSYAGMQVND